MGVELSNGDNRSSGESPSAEKAEEAASASKAVRPLPFLISKLSFWKQNCFS